MNNNYKILISNEKIYREIEFDKYNTTFKIGTFIDSDYRINKEIILSDFLLSIEKDTNNFVIRCEDNCYLAFDENQKGKKSILKHGDYFALYNEDDEKLFDIEFIYNFDYDIKHLDSYVELSNMRSVVIGGMSNCNLVIHDEDLKDSFFNLVIDNKEVRITDNRTSFGIYKNDIKIDKSSIITERDFFSINQYKFYYKNERIYFSRLYNITCEFSEIYRISQESGQMNYPYYNRSTRFQQAISEEEINVLSPSPKPENKNKGLFLIVLPMLLMLGVIVVLRGVLGGGGAFILYSVASMSVGVFVSVINYFRDKKNNKEEQAKRLKEYQNYIKTKVNYINHEREKELKQRNIIYRSPKKSILELKKFSNKVYDRDRKHKDFLSVFLGFGDIEASRKIKISENERVEIGDEIMQIPEKIQAQYQYIKNAPITSSFKDQSLIGIISDEEDSYKYSRNLMLDIAIRHFYKDVDLFFIMNERQYNNLFWVKWLKHCHNKDTNTFNIACDVESDKTIIEYIYTKIISMSSLKNSSENITKNSIVFVYDYSKIINHPIVNYMEKAKEYGFTFVVFSRDEELLPKGCSEIIELTSTQKGRYFKTEDSSEISEFIYENITDEELEESVKKLTGIVLKEVSADSSITSNISLYELLNVFSVDDIDLTYNWEKAKVYETLSAPIGVRAKNAIVRLDIGDQAYAHGPHGLVAGTTGSGKSEVIQTYVLSMASLYHPYDVGFMIIDFKGGGMANQFEKLPHLMGTITNIDGNEIDRSLKSIKAEIVKRQQLFSKYDVNHINKYIKLYKKGVADIAIPHLILIVDEFAELKMEYPDFMKEIISAARIGRTLGIHLILATQKPSGVVDDQIWSNSKFKLCLKVQTKDDSMEMLKSPLAADIVLPGRAYFQVGNNEIFELFQSAYSGTKVYSGENVNEKEFDIYSINDWGKRTKVYSSRKRVETEDAKTQLEVLIDYIYDYAIRNNIKKLPGIIQPSLKTKILTSSLERNCIEECTDIVIPIGIYDDPNIQHQDTLELNLSTSNTYIIGSSQTGKTTMLQTILIQMMKYYTPKEVNVYIIDCANMALKVFEKSSMTGGFIIPTEEEKIKNLFKMLKSEVSDRKNIFSSKGVGTHSSYIEAGYNDVPQICLFIENIAAFKEYYEDLFEEIQFLSREGQSVGITIIATSSRYDVLSYRIASNYANRMSFYNNDINEYVAMFDKYQIKPSEIKGRAITLVGNNVLAFQAAISVDEEKEIDRVNAMTNLIMAYNNTYGSNKAKQVPYVPNHIDFEDYYQHATLRDQYVLPIGVDFDEIDEESIDLKKDHLITILGKLQFGKTNLIRVILHALAKNKTNSPTEVYIIDDSSKSLQKLKQLDIVKKYTANVSDIKDISREICDVLAERKEMVMEHGVDAIENEPHILLVIDNNEIIDFVNEDNEIGDNLREIAEKLYRYKASIIVSQIDNKPVSYTSAEFERILRDDSKKFIFENINVIRYVDVSTIYLRKYDKKLLLGECYRVEGEEIVKIKTIHKN